MELPVNYDKTPSKKRRLVREEYVRRQDGLCHLCEQSLEGLPAKEITKIPVDESLFPKGFFRHPVHLHHDHRTGLTIGAVHAYCNAFSFQYFGV